MAKIKVEFEVPDNKYCDYEYNVCPVCLEYEWGKYYCAIFDNDLEIDLDNGYCIRCNKCKQSEVEK